MLVRRLSLTDFRNYSTAEVILEPGPNLFIGNNGQGKTNLVEALGYLSTLGSHRVSTDQALIKNTAQSAIIRAQLEHQNREVLVELQINRSEPNRAQVNRSTVKLREVPRYFSSVLFAPEDLFLVRGEPSGRRRFLDQLLSARTPRIASVVSDYDRVVKQRNTLLKSARASGVRANQLSTLDIWDDRLIQLGSELIAERNALVGLLQPFVDRAYLSIAGTNHSPTLTSQLSILSTHPEVDDSPHPLESSLSMESSIPASREQVSDLFRAALTRLRPQELDRGITLCGPHRDDLFFELNHLPVKGYASHGESWSFVLALKLASAQLLRQTSRGGDPVVILDDVFAELDEARRDRLADAVSGYDQVLITAAVRGDVPEKLTAHTVQIFQGTIVQDPPDE